MLRDRAAPVDLFALVPALELRFEPELAMLDRLLDDDELFEHVKADLSHRWPRTTVTGRPSTPVEVVLRMLVIQHLYAWSYAQTEHFIGDSLVLRQFCRLGFAPMPHHTTLSALGQRHSTRDTARAAGPGDRLGAQFEGDPRAQAAHR